MNITEIYPQVIMILLSVYSLSKQIIYHDTYRKLSSLTTFAYGSVVVGMTAFQASILYVGGFDFISLPGAGILFFVLTGPAVLIRHHINKEAGVHNMFYGFIAAAIIQTLYYLGGFYDVFGGL
jgi:hypothetical protein